MTRALLLQIAPQSPALGPLAVDPAPGVLLAVTRGGNVHDPEIHPDEGGRVAARTARRRVRSVRWNCKAGKCGSCSAEINGRPRLMCMTRMSVFGHEENKAAFAGPRFLMRIAELDMHPLDAAAESGLDRKATAQEEHGLGYCNITKCCTEVCPEHIKITDNALIPLKERAVDRTYDPLVWLGNKIRRRETP
ncbi:2Fe-2S iron-sulfur cluster-binding protein [Streptomyces sp. NPDC056638]|uniref:2Fe-2S iron-sulfur cluster-binding protein n=1 Tax=Streptomyces sp. NPDC056638 TaxID=3345887 RepID=UPI0036921628